jgi:hypothetical protein
MCMCVCDSVISINYDVEEEEDIDIMYINASSNRSRNSGKIKLGKRDMVYCFISTFESGSVLPAECSYSHIFRKRFGNITEHDLVTARVKNFFPFSSAEQDSEKVVKGTHLNGCACFLKLELNGGFCYQASALFQGRPFQKRLACPCEDGHYSCYDRYYDSYLLDFCTRNINNPIYATPVVPNYATLAVRHHLDSSLYLLDRFSLFAGLEVERTKQKKESGRLSSLFAGLEVERDRTKKKKKESEIKSQILSYYLFDLEQEQCISRSGCGLIKEEDTCHYKKKKKDTNQRPHKYPPKSLPLYPYQRRRHHLFRSFDMRK